MGAVAGGAVPYCAERPGAGSAVGSGHVKAAADGETPSRAAELDAKSKPSQELLSGEHADSKGVKKGPRGLQ